jgi:hypothetical protein
MIKEPNDCNHQLCEDLDSPVCLFEDEDVRIIRMANKLLHEREDIVFVTDGNVVVPIGGICMVSPIIPKNKEVPRCQTTIDMK